MGAAVPVLMLPAPPPATRAAPPEARTKVQICKSLTGTAEAVPPEELERYSREAAVGVVPLQLLGQLSALVSRSDSIGKSSTPPVRMVGTALAASPKPCFMDAGPIVGARSWTLRERDRRSRRQSPRGLRRWNSCCRFERRSAERLTQRNSCRPWGPS